MTPPSLEEILREDMWLRRMARSLVSDPGHAEDLAQDAWVAGLGQGAAGAAVGGDERERRPWLFGALRNRARALVRRESSLRAKAAQAGADSSVNRLAPAVDDVVSEGELRRTVAEALLALEEPYRTAVHLRFFGELSLKEIGQRTDAATSTVSDRVTRGLAMLRSSLDEKHGGDRRRWAPVMLSLAKGKGAAGVLVGGLGLAVGAAVLLGTLLVIWYGERSAELKSTVGEAVAPPRSLTPPGPVVASAIEGGPGGLSPFAVSESGSARAAVSLPRPGGPGTPLRLRSGPLEQTARVVGTFVDSVGRPQHGVTWRLLSWGTGDGRRSEGDMLAGASRRTGVLGADGAMDLSVDVQGAVVCLLTVSDPLGTSLSWRLRELAADQVKDLGEVEFRAVSRIAGRVVNGDGGPLPFDPSWNRPEDGHDPDFDMFWWVLAETSDRGRTGTRGSAAPASAFVNPITGEFSLETVPEGVVTLHVTHRHLGDFERIPVEVTRGGSEPVVIVLDDLAARMNRIEVSLRLPLHHQGVPADPENVWLELPGGTRVSPVEAHWLEGDYVFESTSTADHSLVVADPRLEPVRYEGLTRGERATVDARGSSSVRFLIRTADGQVVETYSVSAARLKNGRPQRSTRAANAMHPLPGGVLSDLVAGDWRFVVGAQGSRISLDVMGLDPGEARTVLGSLADASSVRGRVVDGAGVGVPRMKVRLVKPAAVKDSSTLPILGPSAVTSSPERNRWLVDESVTRSDGGFLLHCPQGGRYLVKAGGDEEVRLETPAFQVTAGYSVEGLELVKRDGGVLEGLLRLPPGFNVDGWRMVADWGQPLSRVDLTVPLGLDGRFRIESIPEGAAKLYLVEPGRRSPGQLFQGEWGANPVGAVVIREGEITTGEFDFPGPLPILVRPSLNVKQGLHLHHNLRLESVSAGDRPTIFGRSALPLELPPFYARAGEYHVSVDSPETLWRLDRTVTLEEGAEVDLELDIRHIEGRVLATRGGRPVPGAALSIAFHEASLLLGVTVVTDSSGYATFHLGQGRYRLRLGDEGGGEEGLWDAKRPSVELQWPPLGGEVELNFP